MVRDKVEGGASTAMVWPALAIVALVMSASGLGCAADPPASEDNDPNTPGATNNPSTGGNAGAAGMSNKPPTTTAGSGSPSTGGNAGAAGGMSSGTAGGGAGSGTTAGASGGMAGGMVDCAALKLPSNADDVISTFEDGMGNVNQSAGRGGGFYMFNDMTGMQTPPPGGLPAAQKTPRCESMFALCMSGKNFTMWGAGMGTDLGPTTGADGGMGSKSSYDASMYKGIQFWAKANPGSALAVRVNFKDANTAIEGGVCNPMESSGPMACNDDWGKNLNLTTSWAPYTILWSELRQAGWGKASTAFEAKKAYSIQFQVSQNLDFDLCIDDLAFVR